MYFTFPHISLGQQSQKQRSCRTHSTAASGASVSTSNTTKNTTNTSDKATLQGCSSIHQPSTNFLFKYHTTGQSTSSCTTSAACSVSYRSPSNDPLVPSRTVGTSANSIHLTIPLQASLQAPVQAPLQTSPLEATF